MSFGRRAGKGPVSGSLAAPSTVGTLPDWLTYENSGNVTYLASVGFAGSELEFTIQTPITGVSIDVGSGLLTADTFAASIQSGTTLTVRATNGSGHADQTFSFTVASARRQRPVTRSNAAVVRASYY